jgi:adenylate cyclase
MPTACVTAKPTPKNPTQDAPHSIFLDTHKNFQYGAIVTESSLDTELYIETTTIMFADVVESVRLIERDEVANVQRIRTLLKRLAADVIPPRSGTVLERRGDGLLVRFPDARFAAACSLALHSAATDENVGRDPSDHINFRIGIHSSDVLTDSTSLFGRGVNTAARIAELSSAGCTVISASARAQLTPALDGDLSDMGDCYVKHVAQPIHLFQLNPPQTNAPVPLSTQPDSDLRGRLAVIPALPDNEDDALPFFGDVLADELIAQLSRVAELRVCSRLTTAQLARRDMTLATIHALTQAEFIITGRYRTHLSHVSSTFELVETATNEVIWSNTCRWDRLAVERCDESIAEGLAGQIRFALMRSYATTVQSSALPTLKSHALLLGGVGLMHRSQPESFAKAQGVFEYLQQRHPRASRPFAWSATWRVFSVFQGWFLDREEQVIKAYGEARRALDISSADSLALTVYAMVKSHLRMEHADAEKYFSEALATNASESLAWVHRGTLYAFQGRGDEAEHDTQRALELSPLDPWRYYFETLCATAALSRHDFHTAISRAKSSLRANRSHSSTWRVLAIAYAELDQIDEARFYADGARRLDPGITVGKYLERSPAAQYETGQRWARALARAGIPLN